jgi:hypothetical protein
MSYKVSPELLMSANDLVAALKTAADEAQAAGDESAYWDLRSAASTADSARAVVAEVYRGRS